MKTTQMFFEDCVGLSKVQLNKADFQRVTGFFLFLSIFGEVVLCCEKG